MPYQPNLDLLQQLGYYGAGGKDPGQRDIDKINQLSGTIDKGLMDYLSIRKAKDDRLKAELERQKLQQENTPLVNIVGGQTHTQTQANVNQVMKQPIPAQDLISGRLDTTQQGLEDIGRSVKQGQDIYNKYGTANVEQAQKIAATRFYDPKTALTEAQTEKALREPIQKPNITTPVIAGGISGREFVKQLKPDLQEGEDMPYGEFLKRANEYAQRMAENRPKPLPSEEVNALSKIIEAQKVNEGIKSQYFDLISKGKSPVDPVGGRWTDLKASWGVLGDEEQAKFMADMATQFNTYLNTLSGAAISVDEAKRLEKRINSAKSTPEQFLGKIQSIQDELDNKLAVRSAILKSANYRIDMDELKKRTGEISYGESKKTKSVAPKMKNLPYKSAEEVKQAYQDGKIDKETARNIIKLNFDIGGKK